MRLTQNELKQIKKSGSELKVRVLEFGTLYDRIGRFFWSPELNDFVVEIGSRGFVGVTNVEVERG